MSDRQIEKSMWRNCAGVRGTSALDEIWYSRSKMACCRR